MTIVEAPPGITGGVDTHADVHVAAALDPLGRLVGSESFTTDAKGYRELLEWLRSFGDVTKVGVEGTGSYGAGLARFLRRERVHVVEVNRPNRQARRNKGKTDALDAIEAARAALSGNAKGHAKTRDGTAEAIRVLVVAKRSARQSRVKALVQMRHLVVSAPEELHQRFKGLKVPALVEMAASLRPDRSPDPVTAATKSSCRRSPAGSSRSKSSSPRSTSRSPHSSPPRRPSCSLCSGSGPTPRRRSWSLQATIQSD